MPSLAGALTIALAALAITAGGASAQQPVEVVDDDRVQCPSAEHTSLTAAVQAAPSGGRVEVCPGHYQSTTDLFVGKPLEIQAVSQPGAPTAPAAAADRESCLTAPAGDPTTHAIVENTADLGSAIWVGSSNVTIDGLVVRGSGFAGIRVGSPGSGYRFSDNVIEDNPSGIAFGSDGQTQSTIDGNCIRRNRNGLDASGTGTVVDVAIEGNDFNFNGNGAILLTGLPGTLADLSIRQNSSTSDGGGFGGFLFLLNSRRVVVDGNDVTTSNRNAIELMASEDVSITNNTLSDTFHGVFLWPSQPGEVQLRNIDIIGNEISGMTGDGIQTGQPSEEEIGLTESRIAENAVVGSGRDGIRLNPGASNNLVEDNVLQGNAEHDCHDGTTGSGTAGTANTWQDNAGFTQNRPGLCTPPVQPECSDGVDNDGDGRVDHPADRQCESPSDASERTQCADELDNDGDGRIDYPADPGCQSARDNSEGPNPQCSDGVDNDGDGAVDYPADPACQSVRDNTEGANPQCSDGVDNDADGAVDYPADRGCRSSRDASEANGECADGVDNDGDGRTDHPGDPGCSSPTDTTEGPDPQCGDGVDNDGDGAADHPADPGCQSPRDNSESPNPQCADGIDNDGDGATDHPADPGCRSARDTSEDTDTPPPL
jgi:nitrous oxidase accessory protein NosD